MSRSGTILLIEDDADDRDILEITLRDLGYTNPIRWFRFTEEAWEYLQTTKETLFIIFCDVNLPRQSGLNFKREVDADPGLRRKSIPFVFFSTSSNQDDVNTAFTEMTVQGYFVKGSNFEEMKATISLILQYWKACKHPNTQ